jgi:hypothetical protein
VTGWTDEARQAAAEARAANAHGKTKSTLAEDKARLAAHYGGQTPKAAEALAWLHGVGMLAAQGKAAAAHQSGIDKLGQVAAGFGLGLLGSLIRMNQHRGAPGVRGGH